MMGRILQDFVFASCTVFMIGSNAFQLSAPAVRPAMVLYESDHFRRINHATRHSALEMRKRYQIKMSLSASTGDDEGKNERAASTTLSDGEPTQVTSPKSKDEPMRGGISRTIVLAVPLMLKFVVVLLIKFLTDLVVFPLLLLYRFARRTKRRVLRLFGATANDDKKAKSLEGINPNGSSPITSVPDTSGLAP